jgi:hypothetical protein
LTNRGRVIVYKGIIPAARVIMITASRADARLAAAERQTLASAAPAPITLRRHPGTSLGHLVDVAGKAISNSGPHNASHVTLAPLSREKALASPSKVR